MGNEQSSKTYEEKLSAAEVRRLLNEQRRMYEKKCEEVIKQSNAQATQNAQAANQNPPPVVQPAPSHQPAYAPPPVYAPQPAYVPQPMHFTQNPNQGQSMPGPSSIQLERQRAPYSYAGEALPNASRASAPPASNLYPNLNNRNNATHTFSFENNNSNPAHDFVFVNRNETQRNRPSAPTRDRSISRSRNNNNENEWLCPTCKTLYGLQIYQCNQGHSSCNSCKEQGRCCGICGNTITTMRNYTLEGLVAEQRMPCRFNNNGCTLSFKMSEMDIHCRECPFKELLCPLGCFWRGQLKQLATHFDALHREQRSVDVDTEIRLRDISNNSLNVYLIVIGAFNFLFHVKVSAADRKVYMFVQLIGTKTSASKWSYELQVYNKGEPRRKFTFSDAVASHVEPLADICREAKCSVLPHAYASTFVHNGALTYKLFIKKTTDKGPRSEFVKNQRGRGRK